MRRRAWIAWVFCSLALLGGARAEKRAQIRIAYRTQGWAGQGFSPAAWHASIRPLLDLISRRVRLSYSLQRIEEVSALAAAVRDGKVNLVLAWGVDYVRISEKNKLRPLAALSKLKRTASRQVLLVRSGEAKRIGDLKGKRLTVHLEDPMLRMYLDVISHRAGRPPSRFFAQVIEKKSHKSAVLDVVFNETDACLVWDWVFETMTQVNPRLHRRLRVLHRSEPFGNPLLFTPASLRQDWFKKLRKTVDGLHKTQEGRQLLLTGKLDRMAPVGPENYSTTRKLWKTYRSIHKKRMSRE